MKPLTSRQNVSVYTASDWIARLFFESAPAPLEISLQIKCVSIDMAGLIRSAPKVDSLVLRSWRFVFVEGCTPKVGSMQTMVAVPW